MVRKSLLTSPPDCPILCKWVLENFILAYKPFLKALKMFETCVLLTNNLCRKLVSSLEFLRKCYERFKVTSVLFLIADFCLLSS